MSISSPAPTGKDDSTIVTDECAPLLSTSATELVDEKPHGRPTVPATEKTRLSPVLMLIFITLCQLVNFFDRGVISGVLGPVGDTLELGEFEKGLLGTAFMLGYMIFAPVSGYLTSYIRATRIMAVGLAIWVVAAACASISRHLYPLLFSRMLLGFGEATFAGIAPSIIDDISLPRQRSQWIAIYFMAMPIGTSLGYIAAGSIATLFSWRVVFLAEALLMVPFPIICFFLPEVSVIVANSLHRLAPADRVIKEEQMRIRTNEQVQAAHKRDVVSSLGELVTNGVFVFTTLGYGFLTFTMGGISLWAADYFTQHLNEDLSYVTKMFGVVSALAGLLGAMAGGLLADKLGGTTGRYGILRTLCIAIAFCVPGVVAGVVSMVTVNPALTFVFSGVAMFSFVAMFSPIISVILGCVPSDLRAFAYSLSLFVAHLIGDFPSPTVVGLLKTALNSLTLAMVILVLWTVGAALLWVVAAIIALVKGRRGDYDVVVPPVATTEEGTADSTDQQ